MPDGGSVALSDVVTTCGMVGGEEANANSITRYVDVAIRNKGHGDVLLEWKTAAA
ncbi:hypothetical protein TB9_05920 [Xanthomonas perforans]|uniref:Uncharacterized protein n=1 Tax=Xanthomonas perforans TaxID=442694 RepID=A0ABR5ENM3_XANPE|nr:hypothetical protein BHE83_07875 [Xanthomonas euvesicatoria pv. vesicatoria str. 85-10]APO89938.1 hypothetical protein BJD11_07620 [Xanthomonas euvesicatoria]APP01748.1 hypothetical protein BJD13_02160 [Xanthomonas perforans]OHX24978.1 hypothetical protein BHL63_15340 [Xanthomonas alfalfae]TKA21110.1 hypothetical protein TP41_05010 [Xanthomonas euvesicatoria pv. citrumelonis]